jgi:hypothetical protein
MNSLIDLLLLHSPLITNIIEGYENDSIPDEFLTLICEDLAKERIIAILSGNFSCAPNEIELIWNFLYKYDIDIKDNFKEYCAKKIYGELNYKFNIINMTTSIISLMHNTCINTDAKCIDCNMAAKKGHLECLKYLHENGCECDSDTSKMAAFNGHLECLKYAHKNGCKWFSLTCQYAAYNGHLECLKYAHKNGCKWYSNTCRNAAENGHFECLKYAHENGCKWNSNTCAFAAKNGHLKCLKYAHKNGCKLYIKIQGVYKHLDCLKYVRQNGCSE